MADRRSPEGEGTAPGSGPVDRPRGHWSATEYVASGALLVVVAAVGALLALDLVGRRSEITRETESDALQQSRLMARWFGTTVISADYVLVDLLDRLSVELPAADEAPGSDRVHALLTHKASTVPGLAGLGFYGPDCVFRHALDRTVIGFRSNQSFCREAPRRVGAEMQVQYVPASKSADGKPALLLSRNRADASGALVGGVLGVIYLDHAQRWIEQFGARDADVMVMLDTSATMLARVPPAPQQIGTVVPLPDVGAVPPSAWESGSFTAAWPLDGTVRICAISRIERIPLAIVVGYGRDSALREWRRRVWQLVPGYLVLSVLAFAALRAYLLSLRRRAELQRAVSGLRDALDNVKVLRGLLPICASCKKIRDDKGYWNQLESYLHAHAGAEFTHGFCPDCLERLYPEDDGEPGGVPGAG